MTAIGHELSLHPELLAFLDDHVETSVVRGRDPLAGTQPFAVTVRLQR